ncbi:hypothetical protein QQX98_001260 [Neonectria punicea]|uniref:Uncharacterized protein n=1 Tax=Neonectria punicea TaxID=979145 RepID=A0ABR1HP18_9HYPO
MSVPDSVPVVKGQVLAPGARDASGRSTYGGEETRQVIALLKAAGIPGCVVDVNALRYYGAGRVTWEWDVCVPAHQHEDAKQIFDNDELYERVKPPPPVPKSLRHLHPTFRLRGVNYYFVLVPSSCCFIDPEMENCDLSKTGIPYPKMPQFARSLLVLQNGSNIADFIDAMNLDEKWGEENIDFDDLQVKGLEFAKTQNLELRAANVPTLNVGTDYRKLWNAIVSEKEGRIEPMKKGRYKTRWRRIKNDIDPRERDRPF